jgi:uncharacterized repeat protein (TIGR03803 family)
MLFGTTQFNGARCEGTVFQVSSQSNDLKTLFDFDGMRADQGQSPTAELLLSRDGRLYGTTSRSGDSGSGTVFRLNRDGSQFEVLHTFSKYITTEGSQQYALIEGGDDAL